MPILLTPKGASPHTSYHEHSREACQVPPGCNNDTLCKAKYNELVTVVENFISNLTDKIIAGDSITFTL
jgi:hypothetical protein